MPTPTYPLRAGLGDVDSPERFGHGCLRIPEARPPVHCHTRRPGGLKLMIKTRSAATAAYPNLASDSIRPHVRTSHSALPFLSLLIPG